MEISSSSSSAQATEIFQASLLKASINSEQRQALALIKSAIPDLPEISLDPVKVGQLLDEKA